MGYYQELTEEQKLQKKVEKEKLDAKLKKRLKLVNIFFWIATGIFIATIILTIALTWKNNVFTSKTTNVSTPQPLSAVVLIFILYFTLSGFNIGFDWKLNIFNHETIIPVRTLDHDWVSKVLADPTGLIPFMPQLLNGLFLVTLIVMLCLSALKRKIKTRL